MTTPGSFESTGLVVEIHKPTIVASGSNVTYDPEGELIDQYNDVIEDWQHTVGVHGGYLKASFAINRDAIDVEDWLMHGLGRTVTLVSPTLNIRWEGFVNQVTGVFGSLRQIRGPLMNIANRGLVLYSELDPVTREPIYGSERETPIQEDQDSKEAYGIFEKILSGGACLTATANQLLTMYLNDFREPHRDDRMETRGGRPNVRIECLGFHNFWKRAVFEDTTSGTITLSTKMTNIIDDAGADPNGLFASTNASIETNGILVERYENDNTPAWTILKGLVARGEAVNDYRTIFMVTANRHIEYKTMPMTPEYERRMFENEQAVLHYTTDDLIDPWDVLPGKWIVTGDFLLGQTRPTLLRDDPSATFIEEVSFRSPDQISINGSRLTTINQRLAQLGLGSMA
jgi:hypothetical protein